MLASVSSSAALAQFENLIPPSSRGYVKALIFDVAEPAGTAVETNITQPRVSGYASGVNFTSYGPNAAEPRPVHTPRMRPPAVVLDDGPLVLVETRRDLAAMTLPFEQTPSA